MLKIQILVKLLLIIFLALPIKTFDFQLNTIHPDDKTLGLSITEIVKSYYLKNCSHINIVKSIKSETIHDFNDVLDTLILTLNDSKTAFQIEDADVVHHPNNIKRSSNLIFIDSVSSFNKILKVLNAANFRSAKVITIISVKELKNYEMEVIFNSLFEHYLIAVNIVTTNSSNSINLYTFLPFKDNSNCDDTTPIIISTFDTNLGKWSNSKNFYNRKANDLMGCSLRIGTAAVSSEPGIMFRKLGDGKIEIYGVEKDLFDEFSKKINFTTNYIPFFNGVGSIYPNGTGFGVLGNILNNDIDIGIGFVSLQYTRTLFLGVSRFYRIDNLMLVVPPGEEYGSLEKLFLPFELFVWIVFYLVLIISIIFSLVAYKFPKIYEFVIGKNINHPVMNILAVYLGMSQARLPSRNFSRFLLLNMLIYCLILRSAYQGAFFNTMVSNKSKPSANTIEEMLQKQYTFYAFESLAARLQGFSFFKHVSRYPNIQIDKYRRMTLNPSFKGAVFSYESQTLYLNQINRKNFTYTMSKQHFMTSSLVFYFRKDHYIVPKINEVLDYMMAHGIVDYITSKYADKRFLKWKPDGGRKVLEINRLYGAIEIYFLCMSISFLIFIMELATKLKRCFRCKR